MAQTYKMKHNAQGTIYSLLTVESDGQMTMTFHRTDREISHEVTENADGWLCYPGGMFPGLESGKWQAVAAQMRNEKLEMRNENEEMRNEVQGTVPAVGSEAESERTTEGLSPSNPPRGKKGSLPREGWGGVTLVSPQTSSTMKAIGMVAAATVALFVIYETGLLIPMGLIGLATGGLLK